MSGFIWRNETDRKAVVIMCSSPGKVSVLRIGAFSVAQAPASASSLVLHQRCTLLLSVLNIGLNDMKVESHMIQEELQD